MSDICERLERLSKVWFCTNPSAQQDIAEAIAEIESLRGGWISVENQKPKIGQPVLCCFNGIVQEDVYIFDSDDNEYGAYYFWEPPFDHLDGRILEPSDLWQPLPNHRRSQNEQA